MAFALAGNIDSPSAISINMEIDYARDGDKIRLPIMEVLLCADACDLARSKKQRDWTPRNSVLLLPFLTEATILNRGDDTRDILNIFARFVTERAEEGEDTSRNYDDDNDKSEVGVEAEDKNTTKTGKTKQATANTLATIADN